MQSVDTTKLFDRETDTVYTYDFGHSHVILWFNAVFGAWFWQVHHGDLRADGKHPEKEAAAYAAKEVADAFWSVPYCE